MNTCVIVGRIKQSPEFTTTSKGASVCRLVIESEKNFRNDDGMQGYDEFRVTLWRGLCTEAETLAVPGSRVAVIGRLMSACYQKDDKSYYNVDIYAEKIEYSA
ncbi:MAG: single-stranded DNA-binding protein [Solobacterium sp.]|nr:single-stranded DNA-binding protein [Solobacterium sp.]